jgi:hypothetical protein
MLEPIITEKLNAGATVTIQPRGTSMLPLIRQGQDEVILKKPTGRLKKYDIPFYKRESGQFVLHRIVKVRKNDYVLCGDNQTDYEYNITDDMILAVVDAIIRNGKTIPVTDKDYLAYCKKHLLNTKKRRLIGKLKKVIKFILRWK